MLTVFDIQRGSYHDGPGIRTVVFLKGCPLRCGWCQNPESHSANTQMMFSANKCIHCKLCVADCPSGIASPHACMLAYNAATCAGCAECVERCCTGALKLVGSEREELELARELLVDKAIFDLSDGGVTLSGGEPLMQYKGCAALLRELKREGVNTALETCGHAKYETLEALLPHLDYVLYDVKLLDPRLHEEHCGADNGQIIENLRRLGKTDVDLWVRTPIIPGVNDNLEFIDELGNLLSDLPNLRVVSLLPFHHLGKNKYAALGKEYSCGSMRSPYSERMDLFRKRMSEMGLPVEGFHTI